MMKNLLFTIFLMAFGAAHGEALFDISKSISNPAKWYDYRIGEVDGDSHSGDFGVAGGKQKVRFSLPNGGMTVIKGESL